MKLQGIIAVIGHLNAIAFAEMLCPIYQMKTRPITILLALSFHISFAQTNENIIGLFGECKEGYFTCSQIEFKSDSTFEYDVFFDVGGWQCWTGKWSMKGNLITINSFSQPETEEEKSTVNLSYSFVSTDYITDLKFRIKKTDSISTTLKRRR